MNWGDLFDRANEYETTVDEIRDRLATHRSDDA
jgi:hypothetical protein